jgi:hypothetical protein
MNLFHVSTKKYEVGQIIKAEAFENTEYYNTAIANGKNWIDELLDNLKPENVPERINAIFAFDCIDNCIAFKGQNEANIYYKVKMHNPIACPMCLTDALKEGDTENNIRISNEYWSPSKAWRFLEYLSAEMEILEILETPTSMQLAKGRMNYSQDRDLKKDV